MTTIPIVSELTDAYTPEPEEGPTPATSVEGTYIIRTPKQEEMGETVEVTE